MGRLIPSRLVAVRHYSGDDAGNPSSPSADDRQLLLDAGIESYVKHDSKYGIAVMVPESQVAAATELLEASSPNLFPPKTVPECPRCRAKDPLARRPYGLAIVAVGFAVAVGAVRLEHVGIAFVLVVVAVVAAAAVESRLPRWRCRSCGTRYGGQDGPAIPTG